VQITSASRSTAWSAWPRSEASSVRTKDDSMTTRSARTGSSFRKIRQQSRDYFQELLKENEQLRHLHVICQERHKDCEQASEEDGTREVNQNDRLLSEQYLTLEQQIGTLARLYVASCRLHGTLDRAQVLDAIEEIIVNLIGSEELAIFELTADGLALSLVACRGIEAARYRTIPI